MEKLKIIIDRQGNLTRPCPPSTKPLIVGWVPSPGKLQLMAEGRDRELPGYWLYELQCKYLPGKIGRLYGWLFGEIYADRPVRGRDNADPGS